MRIPKMRGFAVEHVSAWWIACEQCNDSELVYGSTADTDATVWATEHLREQHGGVIHSTTEIEGRA
jgi:hypothetical protein